MQQCMLLHQLPYVYSIVLTNQMNWTISHGTWFYSCFQSNRFTTQSRGYLSWSQVKDRLFSMYVLEGALVYLSFLFAGIIMYYSNRYKSCHIRADNHVFCWSVQARCSIECSSTISRPNSYVLKLTWKKKLKKRNDITQLDYFLNKNFGVKMTLSTIRRKCAHM